MMSYASWIVVSPPPTERNTLARNSTVVAIACTISATCGVRYFGCSFANAAGIAASTPAANGTRAAPAIHELVPPIDPTNSSKPMNAPMPAKPRRPPTSSTASAMPLRSASSLAGTATSTDAELRM